MPYNNLDPYDHVIQATVQNYKFNYYIFYGFQ